MKYTDLDYINSFNRINQLKIPSQSQSSINASANTFCCDKRKLNSPRQQNKQSLDSRGDPPWNLSILTKSREQSQQQQPETEERVKNHFSIAETFPDIGSNMFKAWFVFIFGLICSCNAASNREAYLLRTERYV